MWLNLYEYDSASYNYKLIETFRDTYFLVAIIDNDFSVGGDGTTFNLLTSFLNVGKEST